VLPGNRVLSNNLLLIGAPGRNHASDISMDRDRTAKTATARAAEAIEAAEMMFADEMGAALDLSSAARMALIKKIAAAIQTAVAEAQQKAEFTDEEVLPSSTC
jgi:hypothetical protein